MPNFCLGFILGFASGRTKIAKVAMHNRDISGILHGIRNAAFVAYGIRATSED